MSVVALPLRRSSPPRAASVALWAFATVAVALGAARAVTTTYVPVLLERIADRPGLIGAVMLVNAAAGFAVPLVTGLWSDKRGSRAPFILGGSVVGAGGLVAIALGTASSYVVLALAAATVYIGLNAASTAHRALVPERFGPDRRAAATGAQEGAMLGGALAGTLVGGALIDGSPAALFALWALLLPLLALPTLAWQRAAGALPATDVGEDPMARGEDTVPASRGNASDRAARGEDTESTARASASDRAARAGASASDRGARQADGVSAVALLAEVLRRDGARQVLIAQVLWVASYAALAPFMVLYAEEVLGLTAAAAGAVLAAFGLLTGLGMLLGARMPAERLRGTLLLGVALLGGGLLAATAASSLAQGAIPFAAAALGAGLVSSVGFPYFAGFVPEGHAGRYAGAFFSARAIASTAALPAAGLLIAATGSYRALLGMGVLGLAGLVPLARAERQRPIAQAATVARPPIRRLAAVIPVYRSERVGEVVAEALRHVDDVLLVDDGAPPVVATAARHATEQPGVHLLRMGGNVGKGTAVAAGIRAALERAPDAVVVLDSDGQHPADLIPAFVAAADTADVVIGDRPRGRAMPFSRRVANAASSWSLSAVVGRRLRDTQNGMRLFRADALRAVSPPSGRFEAETRHLKALVRAGNAVAWVPMPAIYDGEPSSFRPLRDSARVLGAIAGRTAPRERSVAAVHEPAAGPVLAEVARAWAPRLALGVLSAWTVAAALPLLAPLDERLFLAINGLGDGPEWLYQALDPHSRNYLLLALTATVAVAAATRRPRYALGALLAMAFAGVFADLVLEVIQLAVDRPRPEEALGAEVLRSHGRHWSHIPSFPSGHLIVTAALAATAAALAPRLRPVLLAYVAAIAVTRITFGAHFPLDVLVGAPLGWEVGMFTVAVMRAARLVPAAPARDEHAPGVPQPAPATV